MNIHSDFGTFVCQVCQLVFNEKSQYLIHLRGHDEKKLTESKYDTSVRIFVLRYFNNMKIIFFFFSVHVSENLNAKCAAIVLKTAWNWGNTSWMCTASFQTWRSWNLSHAYTVINGSQLEANAICTWKPIVMLVLILCSLVLALFNDFFNVYQSILIGQPKNSILSLNSSFWESQGLTQ